MSVALRASEITLPPNTANWQTILQFLCQRFPFIDDVVWQQRIMAGKVHWHNGDTITLQTPYKAGRRLCYYREVITEPRIPFAHHILYQDADIIVADKPHFLPVTPGGEYVNECLLQRLRQQTGIDDIVPVHRLDRETAGLVLFSINPQSRPAYYQLFSSGTIEKKYQAVAQLTDAATKAVLPQRWQVESCIEKSVPAFVMQNTPGPVNARSAINLIAKTIGPDIDYGLFELQPFTGKTHQLRLHMLQLGMPLLHDKYYPTLLPKQPPQFDKPLQLLARELAFTDPLSGKNRRFQSQQMLSCWRG